MRYLLFLFVFISSTTLAQNGINYQGAATDSDGAKLVDQNISLRTSVLQGGVDGTTSYSENHNTTTDQFGLFNVVIGQGEVISGAFDSISWGADAHFLKVELDATGGTNYNLVSTTQMMSVPYAKYAENAQLDSSSLYDILALMNIGTYVSDYGDTLFINGVPVIIDGISAQNIEYNFGSVSDIEGNVYQTIQIGGQEWMTENLKTTSFSNGDPINEHNFWYYGGNIQGSQYSYFYEPSYTDIMGANNMVYNGYTITDSRNVCPDGWHVPSYAEYQIIFNLFGSWLYDETLTNSEWTGAFKLKKITNPTIGNTNESNLSFETLGIIGYFHYGSGSPSQSSNTSQWATSSSAVEETGNSNFGDDLIGFSLDSDSDIIDINALDMPALSCVRCIKD